MRYKNEHVIWKLNIVTCLKGTHSNKNPNYGEKKILILNITICLQVSCKIVWQKVGIV